MLSLPALQYQCTNNNTIRNNGVNACNAAGRDLENTLCGTYPEGHSRRDAADAVSLFSGGTNSVALSSFYNAFAIAWEKATKNGWSNLQDLKATCEETLTPTKSPTGVPTSPAPTDACRDFDDLVFNNNGQPRDCVWVIDGGRCRNKADVCPMSCNGCACRQRNWVCDANEDCCSGICGDDGECDCKGGGVECEADIECCSGNCRDIGTCGGSGGGGGGGLFP